MCGRYALADPEELSERFALTHLARQLELVAQFNVAPSERMPVVRATDDGNELVLMRWGLIPFWAKDPDIGAHTVNARAEGLEARPSFREPFRQRRCLVPASGFFEWRRTPRGKQPYYVTLKDGGLFAFAGLWDRWQRPKTKQTVESFTVITTPANSLFAPLHDRMPAILPRAHEPAWLDPEQHDPRRLRELLVPYPAELMAAYPVGKGVNLVGTDDPALIAPLRAA